MFDIADIPFSQVPDAEKKAYEGRVKETGTYQGYKLRQYWVCHFFRHGVDLNISYSISKGACETRLNSIIVRMYLWGKRFMSTDRSRCGG